MARVGAWSTQATRMAGWLSILLLPPEMTQSGSPWPPHQSREWTESPQENPVLEYKPGCAQCSYPGESEYQVVFAYAYLAPGASQAGTTILWIAFCSGPDATEKLNSWALLYVNFS